MLEIGGNGSASVPGRFCRPEGCATGSLVSGPFVCRSGGIRAYWSPGVSEPAGTEGNLRRLETKHGERPRGSAQALACARRVEDLVTADPRHAGTWVHRRRARSSASAAAISVSPPHAPPFTCSSDQSETSGTGSWQEQRLAARGWVTAIYYEKQEPRRRAPVLSWDDELQRGIGSGSARPTKFKVMV